jgi:hypothetical protein
MSHAAKHVGGVMETPKMVEEDGPVYEIVPKAKQKEAVDFLNKQLFSTPTWLIDNDIFSKTGINAISTIGTLQDNVLNRLLATRNLSKLIDAEAQKGNSAYTMADLFSDLKKGIWSELPGRARIDVYRRNLQKTYVGILDDLLNPPRSTASAGIVIMVLGGGSTINTDRSDVRSVVRAHLTSLRNEVKAAAAGTTDIMSRYHLQDIAIRIDKALDPKE